MKHFVSFSNHLVVAASLRRGVDHGVHRTATQRRGYSALLLLLLLLASPLHAQVGNNNPSGVSGIFNGLAGGCGYDPYTGNATRSITDIAVAGAVGEYPLALVRRYNSRTPSYTSPFGTGGWNHNYNWILEDSSTSGTSNFRPTRYTVDFPDGRVETFRAVNWNPAENYYRVRPGDDTPQSTSAGVRERLVPLYTGPNNMLAYLLLPDGGKVEFQAAQHSYQQNGHTYYYYKYTATAIVDPYGLRTTLTWENLSDNWKRLTTVTEPAGRYLQFTYTGPNSLYISQVTEVIRGVSGRYVNYYYQPYPDLGLDHVVYYNDPVHLTAHYKYCGGNVENSFINLLWTCDDPMYPGPMKRIAYEYATGHVAGTCTWAVYGQILRERYWDGIPGDEGSGPIVSTLSVCTDGVHNGANYRMETRGDGRTRGFIYTTDGYLTSCTDFMNHSAWQGYDAKKYINSVTDARGQSAGDPSHTTNYVNDPITGNVTQIQFPLTPGDTPDQGNTRPTVNYTYTNNYYLASSQDEAHHTPTAITRDPVSNRVTEIDYPDGGYETFAYDANHFYQLSSHRMTTGGTETFAYDGYHRKQYYSDPYHNNGNNPSIQYFYDGLDRVSGIHDALNHPTDFQYNNRGQLTVTTLATAPSDNQRHTIINAYNPDGTLLQRTDEFGYYAGDPAHTINYQYDDYRRLKRVTGPVRGQGDNNRYTTHFFYDGNGTGDDYRYTDSSVTYVMLPSGKTINTSYDYNRRKSTVIAGYGTPFAATTSYGYDNLGNVTSVVAPNQQNTNQSTQIAYDERNRPSSITDALNRTTSFTYDTAGRKKRVTRPNGHVISCDTFDAMNRVTQQTATNAGTTKYSYTQAGLVQTMQDPHLVAINSTDAYSYAYDTMGRKHIVTYPAEPNTGIQRTEVFNYDAAGHLYQYTTRGSKTQTFAYDALNRMTDFSWNDGSTPSVHFDYDVASRLIGITNRQANNGPIIATISRGYFNDNLIRYETETISGGVARQVSYTYDSDGNRGTLSVPGYSFTYDYTSRNQVKTITDNGSNITSSFWYDKDGNVVQRNPGNGTTSSYTPDALDRITQIVHTLNNGTTRTFNYGYYANSDDRKWTQRLGTVQGNVGDVFSYDYNDQVTAVQLNIANPNTADPGDPSITYDGNGNRIWYAPPGVNKHYDGLSNLSEYTHVVINGSGYNLTYEVAANLAQYDRNNSSYNYDAQNRLTTSTVNGKTMTFKYDGLNRQISRTVTGQPTSYSTWDGWDLVEDYHGNGVADATYLYGPTGLVKNLRTNNYYYQDGSGSTALLASNNGTLREWYRYDLDGTPLFYNPNDTQRSPNQSGFAVRHLFAGQQWYSDVGLYDLRNRFYSPDIGRFLQPDPIGFRGDRSNLYRYCRNNPVTWRDPSGLEGEAEVEPVVVKETYLRNFGGIPPGIGFGDPRVASGGGDGSHFGLGGGGGSGNHGRFYQGFALPNGDFIDTLPQDADDDIVRAPPLGESYYAPGVFPAGYLQGILAQLASRSPVTFNYGAPPWGWWARNWLFADPGHNNWRQALGPFRNGVTITEDGGLGEGIQQQLTIGPEGVTYRLGFGPGVGAGLSITTPLVQGGLVTGPNVQSSVSGGYYGGAALRGTIGAGTGAYRLSLGFGIGFGATVTYGQTVFVPWPWANYPGG